MKLESYKGHLTRSKKKILETLQETQPQSSTSQALVVVSIEDWEEQRNEIPNNDRRENDKQRNQSTRPRSSPLDLQGKQH